MPHSRAELAERAFSYWHREIPDPPEGFHERESATLALTADEASWLSERITSSGPAGNESLLSTLVRSIVAGARIESNCLDGLDNDGDNKIDCADLDCNNDSCGTGCTCAGGVKVETTCNDGIDNNANGKTDCADLSCNGATCGLNCTCAGGLPTETRCNDGIDSDLDGKTDCADSDCTGKQCGLNVGPVCQVNGACM